MAEKKHQEKILLVDDDSGFVVSFLFTFEDTFNILVAKNGQEALDKLASEPDIAVVVSDQRMPDIDGTDLLARVRLQYPMISRVLITGYSDYHATIEAINTAEALVYIQKSLEKGAVQKGIEKAIERHKEVKRKQEEEKEVQKLIKERALEVVQTYTAGIAHHIKNPLVALYTFLDIFTQSKQMDTLDEGMKNLLDVASRDVRRINELIELLVKISQCVLSGFRRINIEKLLELVFSSEIKDKIQEKNVRVTRQVPANLPELYVDVVSIQESIQEILKNAISASEEGKTILLKVGGTEDVGNMKCLVLKVLDEGKGIETKNLKRVFDPFFKGTTDPRVKGLGLTYCQFIVLKHGGELTIDSEVGKGTKVTMKLPVIQPGFEERKIIREEELLEERAKRFLQGRQKFRS